MKRKHFSLKGISKERARELNDMTYQEYLQSAEWQAIRTLVYHRDHGRCRLCNTSKGVMHVHHRKYQPRGREDLINLLLLCPQCHRNFHYAARKRFKTKRKRYKAGKEVQPEPIAETLDRQYAEILRD